MKHVFFTLLLLPTLAFGADGELPESVRAILNKRDIPAAAVSVYAVDLEDGEVMLDWQRDTSRNPGSAIKLLTTLVGIDLLGPAYTWETNLFFQGEVSEGVLDGNLILEGRGDPFMVTERVWQMLRQLKRQGITDIRGRLVIDDHFFQVMPTDPGAFDGQPLRAYNVIPNALLMNFKSVRYWFSPHEDGRRVRIQPDPLLENLRIVNQLRVEPGPCRGYQRGIAVNANPTHDEINFSGRFPAGCRAYAMDRSALSHNEYAYGLFVGLWHELGGTLQGGWQNGRAQEDAEPDMTFDSVPLTEVIDRINKYSNNVMARQLLHTLSAEINGVPGTQAGGVAVVEDWLATHDLGDPSFVMANGAGLSRDTRMTAAQLVGLLGYAWQQTYMPEYVSSLALSGMDGTMRRRFDAAYLDGHAHLKTGSLDHVSTIAGYLQSASGKRYAVAVLVNYEDAHRGPGNEIQEAVMRWLYQQ